LWAAAALVLLCVGLGLGEATGVTDVRGTVIRLFSPEGTLVVEVDDPGVSVTVDGADVVITGAGAKEIRLKPGQYKVEASRDGKVWRLGFHTDQVTDISPVRALEGLQSLDCGGSGSRKGRLSDLSPLRGLRLQRLKCNETQVSDLEPLRGMPIEYLHCEGTRV